MALGKVGALTELRLFHHLQKERKARLQACQVVVIHPNRQAGRLRRDEYKFLDHISIYTLKKETKPCRIFFEILNEKLICVAL